MKYAYQKPLKLYSLPKSVVAPMWIRRMLPSIDIAAQIWWSPFFQRPTPQKSRSIGCDRFRAYYDTLLRQVQIHVVLIFLISGHDIWIHMPK